MVWKGSFIGNLDRELCSVGGGGWVVKLGFIL